MRKQLKTNVEIGDANYVKPGEFFMTLSNDGKTPTSIQRRKDNLNMEVILGEGSDSGDSSKAFKLDLTPEQIESFSNGNDTITPQITPEVFTALRGGDYDSIILNVALEGFDEESGDPIIDYNGTSTLPILSENTRKNLGIQTYFDDWVIAGDSYEFTSEIASSGLGIYKDEEEDIYYIGMMGSRASLGIIAAPYIDISTGTESGNSLILNQSSNWLFWLNRYRHDPPLGKGGTGIIIDNQFYPFYTNQQMSSFFSTTAYEGNGKDILLVGNWENGDTSGKQFLIDVSADYKNTILVEVTGWDSSSEPSGPIR